MTCIVGLLAASTLTLLFLSLQLQRLIGNQRAQIKQQFHSTGIALVALFGDEGLKKLEEAKDMVNIELSPKETFATGLLIQRFAVAYWIRDALSQEEWEKMVVDDGRTVMRSPLLRQRWHELNRWYPKEIQEFFNQTLLTEQK